MHRLLAKIRQCLCIEVAHADVGHGHPIPVPPLFAQQKLVQGRPLEFLLGAAATVVILLLVTDRIGIGLDDDFDISPYTTATLRLDMKIWFKRKTPADLRA